MLKYYQLQYAEGLVLAESTDPADICYHIKDLIERKKGDLNRMSMHVKESNTHKTIRTSCADEFLLQHVCRLQVELRDLKQEMNNFAKNVDESITRLEKRVFAKEIEEKGYV